MAFVRAARRPARYPGLHRRGTWRRIGSRSSNRGDPAIIYSFNYRRLLPRQILECASIGAFNLHPSKLPAYRGRAPINWVLVNGERETGVTLHYMVARADAGDIVGQETVAIEDRDTALSL